MAIITVGPAGKDYTNLAAALLVAGSGDTIEIYSGTYRGTGTNVSLSITKTNITIKAATGETVVFDAQSLYNNIWDFQSGSSGIQIEDIGFTSPMNACVVFRGGTGHKVTRGYMKLDAQGNYGAVCTGTLSAGFYGVEFYQYNDGITGPGAGTYGVYTTTNATVEIDDNCEFHCLAISVYISGTGPVTIGRTLIRPYDWSLGTAYGVQHAGTGLCTISNSIIVGMTSGVYNSSLDNAMALYHNLFDNCTSGAYVQKYCAAIKNNSFIYCNKGIYGDAGGDQPAPDSNHFFGNSTDVYQYKGAVNSAGGDPQLTDRAGHDYTFSGYVLGDEGKYQRTPLCDAGEYISAVTEDYDGNSRPRNGMYDIGPYEFQGTDKIYTNRARETATGDLTFWVSPCNPDPSMVYHPDSPNPADYDDFVIVHTNKMSG